MYVSLSICLSAPLYDESNYIFLKYFFKVSPGSLSFPLVLRLSRFNQCYWGTVGREGKGALEIL